MAKLRAYISYAPANLTFVERIAADLTARMIEVGVDRGLLPTRGGSEAGWDSVRVVIDSADVLLLIASPPAIASPDVQRELQHAVQTSKLIIPLKLRQVALPAPVDTIQWFDFEEGRYDRDLKYLLLNLAFMPPGGAPTYDPTSQMAKLPEPPDRLDALFIAATSAKARNTPEDRERAAAIYASILERDPNFQNGLVQQQLDELNAQLQTQRTNALERYASDARSTGDWAREIAALNAWGRLQGERVVEPLLAVARQNQQHGNLYQQAESLTSTDPAAAAELLRMLYQVAPKFGDPRGLAAKLGVEIPSERKRTSEKRLPVETPPQPARAASFNPTNPIPATGGEPAAPPPQQTTTAATAQQPWVWYAAFAVVGAVLGAIIGGAMAAPLYDDFRCYASDGFGVVFVCDDPSEMLIGLGVVIGLGAAYYLRRTWQRN